MTSEEILDYFYDKVTYKREKNGWKTTFDAESFRGRKLNVDLVDAKKRKPVANAGDKLTQRKIKQLVEDGLKEISVADEELIGQYSAKDLFDPNTGEIFFQAGDEITSEVLEMLAENKVKDISVLAIDHTNVGAYMRNTMFSDKNTNRDEALVDIYRVMRPGEPPTLETAEALFHGLFFCLLYTSPSPRD